MYVRPPLRNNLKTALKTDSDVTYMSRSIKSNIFHDKETSFRSSALAKYSVNIYNNMM